jgi:hypothetical protein
MQRFYLNCTFSHASAGLRLIENLFEDLSGFAGRELKHFNRELSLEKQLTKKIVRKFFSHGI